MIGRPDPFCLIEESVLTLRTILVGLDGSEHSDSALGLAIGWAKRFDALLLGMGCIGEPGVNGPEEYLLGKALFEHLLASVVADDRDRVKCALSRSALRCAEAGVAFKPLEHVGTPHVQILTEVQRYDVIVLGRHTHFRYGWQEEPHVTLSKVLADSPRPVVAVPDEHWGGETVVVAYDGSLQAARALSSFVASGLGDGREIHVISVARQKSDAARCADRAVEFLKSHGLDSVTYPVNTDDTPAVVLLEMIRLCDPELMVMGADGQPIPPGVFPRLDHPHDAGAVPGPHVPRSLTIASKVRSAGPTVPRISGSPVLVWAGGQVFSVRTCTTLPATCGHSPVNSSKGGPERRSGHVRRPSPS